jgi:twinkle protein
MDQKKIKANLTFSDYNIIADLSRNGWQKVKCPECTPHRKKKNLKDLGVNVEKGIWFCHHCGWKGSLNTKKRVDRIMQNIPKKTYKKPEKKKTTPLPDKVLDWFKKRGISREVLEVSGVTYESEWMPQTGKPENCIVFNMFINSELINKKYRDGNKNFRLAKDARLIWYAPMKTPYLGNDVYITEGEVDALTLLECGYESSISTPNGAPPEDTNLKDIELEFFNSLSEIAPDMNRAYLIMDNDKVGARFRDEIARRIGVERCYFAEYPEGCKDINDVMQKHGKETVKKVIDNCKPYPIAGKYDVSDLADRIYNLYTNGFEPGMSTGWNCLDKYYTVRQRELTVLTGIPGHGKSSWLDHLMHNLSLNHGWSFGIFSPENFPFERHIAKLCEIYIGKPFDRGFHGAMSENELGKACEWCNKHFHFLMPEEDNDQSLKNILDLAKASIFKDGIHGLVIDPWNEIEHEYGREPETVYISKSLTKIRKFNRVNNIHTWLVAHPTKLAKDRNGKYPMPNLYDISGSAHFYNKPDNGVIIHRDFEEKITEVCIPKVRFKEIGKPGKVKLNYDVSNGRYHEV